MKIPGKKFIKPSCPKHPKIIEINDPWEAMDPPLFCIAKRKKGSKEKK